MLDGPAFAVLQPDPGSGGERADLRVRLGRDVALHAVDDALDRVVLPQLHELVFGGQNLFQLDVLEPFL